jgi:hypothetical protein
MRWSDLTNSGLPVSLKDQIDVKGVNHTMSYVARIGDKADKDAVITEILLKQGVCHPLSLKENRLTARLCCIARRS